MDEDKNETKKSYMFNGKDFNNWKFRMEILLREHDAEKFITKSLEEHEEIIITNLDDATARRRKNKLKEDLQKKERKCYSLIVQRIANDYLEYVKDKANPKEAWSSLCAAFERKGVSNRMFLRRKLLSMKMAENDKLENHLLEFEKGLRDLKSVGAKMEEEDIICQLLLSLPKSYEPIVTALETMKAQELTMEFVKGRLLDCDIKRKTNFVGELHEVPTAMVAHKKKNIVCYICDPTIDGLPFIHTPYLVFLIELLYLYVVLKWGPDYMKNRPAYSLKTVIQLYNVTQIFFNVIMIYIGLADLLAKDYFEMRLGPNEYKLCYGYFLLKLYDFFETVILFVLRKKQNQVSFLHVYHHLMVLTFVYFGMRAIPGGHNMVYDLINTSVHAIMYIYYFLAAYDSKIKWLYKFKKFITQVQLIQFVILLFHYSWPLYYGHCCVSQTQCILHVIQAAIMIGLFGNFYIKNYIVKNKIK